MLLYLFAVDLDKKGQKEKTPLQVEAPKNMELVQKKMSPLQVEAHKNMEKKMSTQEKAVHSADPKTSREKIQQAWSLVLGQKRVKEEKRRREISKRFPVKSILGGRVGHRYNVRFCIPETV